MGKTLLKREMKTIMGRGSQRNELHHRAVLWISSARTVCRKNAWVQLILDGQIIRLASHVGYGHKHIRRQFVLDGNIPGLSLSQMKIGSETCTDRDRSNKRGVGRWIKRAEAKRRVGALKIV